MPSGKHKIPRDKAEKMIKKFKEEKGSGKPLPMLPDGYIFDADDVKTLLSHPHAKYFILSFGINETQGNSNLIEEISPILTVADSEYKTLQLTTTTTSNLMSLASESTIDEEGGGYLDEGRPYPPPTINP